MILDLPREVQFNQLNIQIFVAPFRQSLSLPAMERRGKVVMLDPQSSMVADSSEAALYNWKTVKRNHYDEALARTSKFPIACRCSNEVIRELMSVYFFFCRIRSGIKRHAGRAF